MGRCWRASATNFQPTGDLLRAMWGLFDEHRSRVDAYAVGPRLAEYVDCATVQSARLRDWFASTGASSHICMMSGIAMCTIAMGGTHARERCAEESRVEVIPT